MSFYSDPRALQELCGKLIPPSQLGTKSRQLSALEADPLNKFSGKWFS